VIKRETFKNASDNARLLMGRTGPKYLDEPLSGSSFELVRVYVDVAVFQVEGRVTGVTEIA